MKQKLLRVSGRFELSRVRVTEIKIIVNVWRKSIRLGFRHLPGPIFDLPRREREDEGGLIFPNIGWLSNLKSMGNRLFRVNTRFELARVRVIGSGLYFWHPNSRAYFQSQISPWFCFKIPNPELHIWQNWILVFVNHICLVPIGYFIKIYSRVVRIRKKYGRRFLNSRVEKLMSYKFRRHRETGESDAK